MGNNTSSASDDNEAWAHISQVCSCSDGAGMTFDRTQVRQVHATPQMKDENRKDRVMETLEQEVAWHQAVSRIQATHWGQAVGAGAEDKNAAAAGLVDIGHTVHVGHKNPFTEMGVPTETGVDPKTGEFTMVVTPRSNSETPKVERTRSSASGRRTSHEAEAGAKDANPEREMAQLSVSIDTSGPHEVGKENAADQDSKSKQKSTRPRVITPTLNKNIELKIHKDFHRKNSEAKKSIPVRNGIDHFYDLRNSTNMSEAERELLCKIKGKEHRVNSQHKNRKDVEGSFWDPYPGVARVVEVKSQKKYVDYRAQIAPLDAKEVLDDLTKHAGHGDGDLLAEQAATGPLGNSPARAKSSESVRRAKSFA